MPLRSVLLLALSFLAGCTLRLNGRPVLGDGSESVGQKRDYDDIERDLLEAERLENQLDPADATARFSALYQRADGELNQVGERTSPSDRFSTRNHGELGRDELSRFVGGLKDRAQKGYDRAWARTVAALKKELGATSAAQEEVLFKQGRPTSFETGAKGQQCWVYASGAAEDVYCWGKKGGLSSHDQRQAPMSVLGYYAAETYAAGECMWEKCSTEGWKVQYPEGEHRTTCNWNKCSTEGWTTEHPDGTRTTTQCKWNKCLTEGWTTTYSDNTQSETTCKWNKCASEGWETRWADGSSRNTTCKWNKCLTEGWTSEDSAGGMFECTCKWNDCLKNGASCEKTR